MKKWLCLLLVGVLLLSMSACTRKPQDPIKDTSTPATQEPTNGETDSSGENIELPEPLSAVLNSEKPFVDENGGTNYLKDYKFSPTQTTATVLEKYTLVDFDRDGVEELVVYTPPYGGNYLVFHIQGNQVCGFVFGVRELTSLKTDGSFCQSGGAALHRYATLRFKGSGYILQETVYVDDMKQEYTVNGEPISAERADALVREFENKPDVTWYKFTNGADIKYRTLYTNFWDGLTTAIDSDGRSKTLQEYLGGSPIEDILCYYTYRDVTGDGVEDFCVRTVPQKMYFFTVKNDQLYHWYTEALPYVNLLNNGAFLYERHGGAPTNIIYQYYELDANGAETFRITFAWYDGKTVEEGKVYPDRYFVNDEEVSKEEYEATAQQYLKIGTDKIVWYDKDGNCVSTPATFVPVIQGPPSSASNPELAETFVAILKNEKTFYSDCFSYGTEEGFLSDYLFDRQTGIWKYSYVNMDSDNNEELIIGLDNAERLLLRKEGESVFGFLFSHRGMDEINQNGTFQWHNNSDGLTYGCARLSFSGSSYPAQKELWRVETPDSGPSIFYINQKPVSEEAFRSASKQWDSKPVSWIFWKPTR